MSNNISMTETFQQKMFGRIRDQIGELMSDEDLKKLVDAAIDKSFFEPREPEGRYSSIKRDPLIVEIVTKLLEQNVTVAAREYIKENPGLFRKATEDALAKGMYGLVKQHVENMACSHLQELSQKLVDAGL